MSHFTLMVRVPAETREAQLEECVGALLDPYCEHTDKGRLDRYFEFHDHEDERRQQYMTESNEMIRLEDGTLVLPWDERFRMPGSLGHGSGTRLPPAHLQRVEVPYRERYATFEQYMKDWHSEDSATAVTPRQSGTGGRSAAAGRTSYSPSAAGRPTPVVSRRSTGPQPPP
jgi:hypothetical protein